MPLRGESSSGASRHSGSGSMAGVSGTAGGNNKIFTQEIEPKSCNYYKFTFQFVSLHLTL